MNPLISLVIPVYNVEKYLEKCLQSVSAQTYDNLEIILVDDGSTDNSGKMCDEYAKINSKVRVYHKPNGGLSDARNYGVERSNASLVSFIDSDDYVAEDYLTYLWYLMEKYSADLSVGQFARVEEKHANATIKQNEANEYCLDTENALKHLCVGDCISTVAWGKLYRRDALIKNKYPLGKYYEDIATTYKLIGESSIIAVGSKKIYYYLQRDMSILHSKVCDKHLFGLSAAEEMCEYISNVFPNVGLIAHKRCCTTAIDIIIRVFSSKDVEKEYYYKVQGYLMKHYKIIKCLKEVNSLFKVDCLIYSSGYINAKSYHYIRCFVSKIKGSLLAHKIKKADVEDILMRIRLKHCNLSTIPKKGTQNQGPRSGPKSKIEGKTYGETGAVTR